MPVVSTNASGEVLENAPVYSGGGLDRLALDTLYKAAGASSQPAYVRHYRSEAARRYASLHNGILQDITPHLDANLKRRLAGTNGVIQAVINTRINQVADNFRRPQNERGFGLRAVQKDRSRQMTSTVAREAHRIEEILFRGGVVTEHPVTGEPAVWDGHFTTKALPLGQAIRTMVRDTLTLDQVFFSVESARNERANPVMFWRPEDAALIRMVDTALYRPRIRNGNDGTDDITGEVSYVMLDPGTFWGIVREYRWNEGLIGFRNPRTDFGTFGYGKSEVEQCLDAVLGVNYAMRSNRNYFTDNHIPMGFLHLIGNYNPGELDFFKLIMTTEIGTQVGGDYRVPMLRTPPGQGASAQWVQMLDRARQDMVFRAYMEFCIALVSAVFQIAPEEFNFGSFGGPDATLQEADPESRIVQSQHKGLLPLITFFLDILNQGIVERLNPDFEVIIQGLDSAYTPESLLDAQLDETRLMNGFTPNMIRRLRDEADLIDPLDKELWDQISAQFSSRWYPSDAARQSDIVDAYRAAGGELGDCYDAPVGNPGALQIWMAQHNIQMGQDVQSQMGEMAQGDAAGQQQGELDQQSSANEGLQAMQDAEMQNAFAQDAQDKKDKDAAVMRIPMAEDAGQMRRARGRRPQATRKSIYEAMKERNERRWEEIQPTPPACTGQRRRRVVLGPRDE